MAADAVSAARARETVAALVSRETLERLDLFANLALRWNRTHNLFATSTESVIWHRHILDSVQLLPLVCGRRHFLDFGSGAGFPGIVLAIANIDHAHSFVHLIDSNAKKSAFLNTVIGTLNLKAQAHPRRVEEVSPAILKAEIVTARAVASLNRTLQLAAPWLRTGAVALLHKGREFEAELAEAAHHWTFQVIKHRSLVASDSVILEISDVKSVA